MNIDECNKSGGNTNHERESARQQMPCTEPSGHQTWQSMTHFFTAASASRPFRIATFTRSGTLALFSSKLLEPEEIE